MNKSVSCRLEYAPWELIPASMSVVIDNSEKVVQRKKESAKIDVRFVGVGRYGDLSWDEVEIEVRSRCWCHTQGSLPARHLLTYLLT